MFQPICPFSFLTHKYATHTHSSTETHIRKPPHPPQTNTQKKLVTHHKHWWSGWQENLHCRIVYSSQLCGSHDAPHPYSASSSPDQSQALHTPKWPDSEYIQQYKKAYASLPSFHLFPSLLLHMIPLYYHTQTHLFHHNCFLVYCVIKTKINLQKHLILTECLVQ